VGGFFVLHGLKKKF